jgi:hypothetical protein
MATPHRPDTNPPRPPMTLEDSAIALARLNEQMQQLTAKLEYVRLLLKLGVR